MRKGTQISFKDDLPLLIMKGAVQQLTQLCREPRSSTEIVQTVDDQRMEELLCCSLRTSQLSAGLLQESQTRWEHLAYKRSVAVVVALL